MRVVGINFNKLNSEKISDSLKDLKINTKIDISEVRKPDNSLFKGNGELIEISFNYDINYNPKIAKISLSGKVMVVADSKTSKEFLDTWKKKKLPDQHRVFIFNVILRKSNIRAIQLEDELNLPSHIPFPLVQEPKKK